MITIDKTIKIHAPIDKVFAFWKNYENFSKFIEDIESVKDLGNKKSHWIMKGPFNSRIEFDADTVQMDPEKYIKWVATHAPRSLKAVVSDDKKEEVKAPGTGEIFFKKLEEGLTEVQVKFSYTLPNKILEVIAGGMDLVGFPSNDFKKGLHEIKGHLESK